MKRFGILNHRLAAAVAKMGHDDIMIVCDAGFPVNHDEVDKVIDLTVVPGVPDLLVVLKAIRQEMWVERVAMKQAAPTGNPRVCEQVERIFPDAEFGTMPNEWFHREGYTQAKYIIRTAAWLPYGDVALWSGIPVAEWFDSTHVPVPEEWRKRYELNVKHGGDGLEVSPTP